MQEFRQSFKVEKMDAGLRLVRGWAVVSSQGGKPYIDTQEHYIPTGPLLKAAIHFMKASRMSDDMHDEVSKGIVVESTVIDDEWCAAFEATIDKRGWAVGIQFPDAIFAKFASGEYTGFSIGGRLHKGSEMVCPECGKAKEGCSCGGFEKRAVSGAQNLEKNIEFEDFTVNFISAVDYPAQEPAQALMLVKAKNLQSEADSRRSEDMADVNDEILTKLRKRNALVEGLTPAQFGFFKNLDARDGEMFLEKSNSERDAMVEKAVVSDPVVHTSPDGTTYLKSAGPAVIALAKQNDALVKMLNEQKDIAKANLLKARLEPELGAIPATDIGKVALLEAIDSIDNVDVRKAALDVVHKGNEAYQLLGKSNGTDGAPPKGPEGQVGGPSLARAQAEYLAGVHAYAKAQNIKSTVAHATFAKTKEGAVLHEALEKARTGPQSPRLG